MNTSTFTIAAAQSSSIKGSIRDNVRRHSEFVVLAKEYQADVVVFPELSLTGYEPTVAAESAIGSDDDVLGPLLDLANDSHVTIIAGCPIRSAQSKPFIGAFILRPDRQIKVYRKRFVHPSTDRNTVVCSCHGRAIGIAICADINHAIHPADARKQNATVYAACVAKTPGEIGEAEANMSKYAKQYRMLAVMSNYASATGGYPMAGRSAVWDESGGIVAQADGGGECIVLAENTPDEWVGRVVTV